MTTFSTTRIKSCDTPDIFGDGLLVPVIVNKGGIVLDGHNRFCGCKELGIPLQYHTKEFDDPLEEKKLLSR